MKTFKPLFILILIILINQNTIGQTNRWDFIVGGNFTLNFNTLDVKDEQASVNISRDFGFNIKPVFGYFFSDNVAIGIIIDYSYSSSKYQDEDDGNHITDKSNAISAGPFLRIYLGDSYVKPFIHGDFSIGNYNLSQDYDDTNLFITSYDVGGGVAFFLNEYVSLEVLAYYGNTSLKRNYDSNIKQVISGFNLDVGFIIYL